MMDRELLLKVAKAALPRLAKEFGVDTGIVKVVSELIAVVEAEAPKKLYGGSHVGFLAKLEAA